MNCSLVESYRKGYEVLVTELIDPLFDIAAVTGLDIFLISSLNMDRRTSYDLDVLRSHGEPMLHELIDRYTGRIAIRTVGTYLEKNIELPADSDKLLTLVLGSRTGEDIGCPEVDVFLRTGGELRLSGAPRTIIGDYTQLYAIPTLHPDLRFSEVKDVLDNYRRRYMREVA